MTSSQTSTDHRCFGCQHQISDHEPHIHVGLDEWAGTQGLSALGMDDLLMFAICEPCTVRRPDGKWQLEAHEIGGGDA